MKLTSHRAVLFLGALALCPTACLKGKGAGSRDSGQSKLMDSTFAGQNACNPDDHDRPFIIEWDATDMSSFEAHAANDIVIVKYEGCKLKVLDECKNDSIRGEQGAYRPPEWTSGSLETIDISNEAELYAKLPLGHATLGGRVSGGEKFHMEYFVAGTRNATRDSVYLEDIRKNPGCEGATHFVYAYNLGAFALGSAAELNTQAGGSIYGFGAGGSTSSKRNAEKKGGDLGVCRSDVATEVAGCKAPIRLALRKIRDGENPEAAAMTATDTPESLNAAGIIARKADMNEKAYAHYESAVAKFGVKDGKGCVAELDAHDKHDPKHSSTDPKSAFAFQRGMCLMTAGKCDAGKQLLRKAMENGVWAQQSDEQRDAFVENMTVTYCQGKLGDREALLKDWGALSMAAATGKPDAKTCDTLAGSVRKLVKKVKAKDDEDYQVINAQRPESVTQAHRGCLARAGACDRVWKDYRAENVGTLDPKTAQAYKDANYDYEGMWRQNFESMFPKCKGKK